MAALSSYQRRDVLEHCVTHFKVRHDVQNGWRADQTMSKTDWTFCNCHTAISCLSSICNTYSTRKSIGSIRFSNSFHDLERRLEPWKDSQN